LASVLCAGCSPRTAEEAEPQEEQALLPAPTPAPILRLATDYTGEELEEFSLFLTNRLTGIDFSRVEIQNLESEPSDWDLALYRVWSYPKIHNRARDLAEILDRAYPPHRADFILSASDFTRDGKLLSLPIVLLPDFIYSKRAGEWRGGFNRSVWEEYLSSGGKVALPGGPKGEWYAKHLNIPAGQILTATSNTANPYQQGAAEVAIHNRSWVTEQPSTGASLFSLADLDLESGVPAWALRVSLAADAVNEELARTLLTRFLVELQDSLFDFGASGLPLRRSIYQSPRMQGAFLGAPRAVFDSTIAAIAEVDPATP
jgi:hypothetical protein